MVSSRSHRETVATGVSFSICRTLTRNNSLNLEQQYDSRLHERKASGLFRKLPDSQVSGVDFTNNDYLGLSQHPAVISRVSEAVKEFGLGGQASRLLGAQAEIARRLEQKIAAAKSSQGEAIVYSTGFQLNASVIATLLDPNLLNSKPVVFTDRLIHNSILTGIKLAGARQFRFAHNDLDHLESLIQKKANSNSACFVFVESIYGMDGDRTPLEDLYRLKKKYNFFLYVDEAHSVGVEGDQGYGLATQGPETADAVIGTFSKALGAAGGFVVASPTVKDLLVNFSGGLIYSTAPSPAVLAGVETAWDLLPTLNEERERVIRLASWFRKQLSEKGLSYGSSDTHIVPVILGDAERAMKTKYRLSERELHVACVRPPTVPAGTSRLRISLNVNHTEEQVRRLVEAIVE